MPTRRIFKATALVTALLAASTTGAGGALGQQQPRDFIRYDRFESEREDRLTGGHIERAEFEPGQPDIKLTLNVPSFRLTLWQNGKEVKSYSVGVGMKDYPIYIGEREAREIIWNPPWIPPASDWVGTHKGVRPGQVIKAGDPRNPIGKLKIPLGDAYLIHQAARATDLGNLVSHGCASASSRRSARRARSQSRSTSRYGSTSTTTRSSSSRVCSTSTRTFTTAARTPWSDCATS
ncbi:MAG: hypothetical protein DMF65_02050 [Acidobacteria bacterium]|nr:MAG: hypothetical protein DMF65_02050 [Acidobacteriota bacterium]